MNAQELEDRLIEFAVLIIKTSTYLSRSFIGRHLANQLVRSGTSPALNYGEARAAESKKDFIHKIKISLKELRETYINLKIVKKSNLPTFEIKRDLDNALKENDELIRIFVAMTKTSDKGLNSTHR